MKGLRLTFFSLRATLITLVLLIAFLPSAVFAASLSQVNIHLLDAEAQPLKNVQVSLDLHFYECATDAHGRCSILIGDTRGLLLRGTLDLGMYGSRIVAWRGGALDVPIEITDPAQPDHTGSDGILLLLSAVLGVVVLQRRRIST